MKQKLNKNSWKHYGVIQLKFPLFWRKNSYKGNPNNKERLSVCRLSGTDFSGTTWPILMKLCMCFIHALRMMSDKKISISRKKIQFREIFSDFFRTFQKFHVWSILKKIVKILWKCHENEGGKKRAKRA